MSGDPNQAEDAEGPAESGPGRRRKIVAMAIAIAVAGAALALTVPNGSHAELKVEVVSDLLVDTMLTMYVDDKESGTLSLGAMERGVLLVDCYWSLFDGSKTVGVRGEATGGFLGAMPDKGEITLEKDGKGTVRIHVRYPSCH